MKEPKKLLITFDYELFLGKKSGSVDKCIIQPTNRVLEILNNYPVKAIFFVDTVYLLKLKSNQEEYPAVKADYEKIIAQLKQLVQSGHYLFPHIHAHWQNAIYSPGTNMWKLHDFSNYRFHNLDQQVREQIFSQSFELMNSIILPIKPDYTIDGYRAGGWCIQPFSDFKTYFEKYNITNDFSVIPGLKSVSEHNHYDFTNAKKHIYLFNNDVLKEENGPFCEFPVSTIFSGAFEKFIYKVESKILWKLNIKNIGDGNAALFSPWPASEYNHQVVSIDTMLLSKTMRYRSFIKNNDYVHFASHPKMLSSYNTRLFKNLLDHMYNAYTIISDYKKMKPDYAAENLNSNRYKAELH
jgi:hypothetical protein